MGLPLATKPPGPTKPSPKKTKTPTKPTPPLFKASMSSTSSISLISACSDLINMKEFDDNDLAETLMEETGRVRKRDESDLTVEEENVDKKAKLMKTEEEEEIEEREWGGMVRWYTDLEREGDKPRQIRCNYFGLITKEKKQKHISRTSKTLC